MENQLSSLPFGETLHIDNVTITRSIIGIQEGWRLTCGIETMETRDIRKAIEWIEKRQIEIIDMGQF
jgi:hypothetical protein